MMLWCWPTTQTVGTSHECECGGPRITSPCGSMTRRSEIVGVIVGVGVGTGVGRCVGGVVGLEVGTYVGMAVGTAVGTSVGLPVGAPVGTPVGTIDGGMECFAVRGKPRRSTATCTAAAEECGGDWEGRPGARRRRARWG